MRRSLIPKTRIPISLLFIMGVALTNLSIRNLTARDRIQIRETGQSDLTVHLKYLNSADEAFLKNNYKSALTNYFKYLTYALPRDKSLAWDELGYIYLRTGEPEKGKVYLEDVVRAAPHNYNPRFYLALTDLLLDDFAAAFGHLSAIDQNIHFDASWLEAASGSDMQNPEGEPVSPEELEFLEPEKGVLLLREGEEAVDGARTLFLDAFDERNIPVYFALWGVVLREKGRDSESREAFQAAVDLSSGRDDLSSLVERLSATPPVGDLSGNHGEIIKVLAGVPSRISHSFDSHPTNLQAGINQKFVEELRKGHLPEAADMLRLGLSIDGSSYEFNHNLALLSYDEGDLETAGHSCARTIFFHPEAFGALDLMGNILYRKKKFTKARDYFVRALLVEPDNVFSLYTCGACNYYLYEMDSAEKYWTEAINLAQKKSGPEGTHTAEMELSHEVTVRNLTVLFLSLKALGSLCMEQARTREAIGHLRKALPLRPEDPETLFLLGNALARLEEDATALEIKEAISHLEKYIFLGGKNVSDARALLKRLHDIN